MANAGLDKETVFELLDRLNVLEVQAQIPGVVRAQPQKTATRLKEELTTLYDQYVFPLYTRAMYSQRALVQAKRKLQIARQREIQEAAQGRATNNADIDFWKANRQYIIQQNGASYGYDFNEERYDTDRPLSFDGEVDLNQFQQQIEYFSDTDSLSLPGTLRNILQEAQRRGFDAQNLGELLHKFVGKYFPDQKIASLHFCKTKDFRSLFLLLVEQVDPENEGLKIKQARSQLSRRQGENLSTVIFRLQSLCYQELQLCSNGMDPITTERKSCELAQLSFKDFVTREVWAIYDSWVYTRLSQNKTTGMREGLRKIDSIEKEHPEMKPQGPLSIKSAKILDPQSLSVGITKVEAEVQNKTSWPRSRSSSVDNSRSKGRRFDGRNNSQKAGSNNDFRRGKPQEGSSRSRPFSRPQGRDDRGRSTEKARNPFRSGTPGPARESFRGRSRDNPRESFRDRRESSGSFSRSGSRDRTGSPRFRGERSPARYQRGGRDRPRDQRDRSWSLGRSGSQERGRKTFRRSSAEASPRSFKRGRSRTPERGQCFRCLGGHLGKDCVRYPQSTETPCFHCEKRGIRLYHRPEECRFRRESTYRTPSPRTREARTYNIDVSQDRSPLN